MKLRALKCSLFAIFAFALISLQSPSAMAQEITYYTFDTAPGTSSYNCQDPANDVEASNPLLCFNDGTNPGSGTNPSFGTDSLPSNLNPGGDGSGNHTVLNMNLAEGGHAESAWFSVPQKISDGFTSYFAFRFSQGTSPFADGLAFVVQNAHGSVPPVVDQDTNCSAIGSGPSVVGGGGGCLGYSGIDNSLAVEFDTYTNDYDPNGQTEGGTQANHIAVQSCGSGVNSASHLPTGCLVHDELVPTNSAINDTLPLNLSDGQFHEVVVEYSGAGGTPANLLSIYVDPAFVPGTHTPIAGSTPVISVTYTFNQHLELLSGDSAYVGFTAATGALFEQNEIAAWTYTPHEPATQQQPLAAAGDLTPFPFGAHTYGVTYPSGGPDTTNIDMVVTANPISPVLYDELIASQPSPLNTTHCQIFDSTGGNCIVYTASCVDHNTQEKVVCPTTDTPTIGVKSAFESFNGVDPLNPGLLQGDPFYSPIDSISGDGTNATATCHGECSVSLNQIVSIKNSSVPGFNTTVTATAVSIDTFTFASAVNATTATGQGGFVTSSSLEDICNPPGDPTPCYQSQKIDGTTSGKTKNFSSFVATGVEPIAFLSADNAQGRVGLPFEFTVSASGYPPPTISESLGNLPAELTFANGVISGTPTTANTYALKFHAVNTTIAPAQDQNFSLVINPAPALVSIDVTPATPTITGGHLVQFTATGNYADSSVQDLTSKVVWNSANTSTADITPLGLANGVNGGTSNITATLGNIQGATTLTVSGTNTAPTFTSAAATTFLAGTAGSFPVSASGTPAPTFSAPGVPSGVSLSSAGVLTSTTAAAAGIYTFSITASNGVSPDATQSFKLTISKPPTFTSAASKSFTFGTPGLFNVTASGVPAPTFSASGLPSGVSLSTAGALTSTATAAASVYHFNITATNGIAPDAIQAFTLTIQGGAPQFTSAATTTFTAGVAGSFNVVASGTPAPTFKVYSGSLPSGVSLSSSGLLKSSTSAKAGTYNFGIKATNGKSPDATQAFSLIIQQPVGSISLSPTSLAFGDVFLGTRTHKAISITNTSSQPVMITKLTFTAGTGPSRNDYGYDFECGDILKPGQKCTVTIELHAQDIGPGTSTLNIFFNGPTAQVPLSGNVINPKAKLSTSSLSFGNVKVGTSATKPVTLTNNGDSDLLISNIALSGQSDFSKTASTCPATLARNLSCTVTIKFTPTAKSTRTGTLKFTDNANPSTQSVSLTGKGN